MAVCFFYSPAAYAKKLFQWGARASSSSLDAKIINGAVPANPQDWPASFWTQTDPQHQCTVTLVGPVTLLTAAHCVQHQEEIALDIGRTAKCYQADGFHTGTDSSADYAFCILTKAVQNIPFERIDRDSILKVGDELKITGFGCTSYPDQAGVGVFRTGKVSVLQTVGQLQNEPSFVLAVGDAVLCVGDSGGGSFIENQLSKSRRIVGVNSKFYTPDKQSFLSGMNAPAVTKLINDWASKGICGVNLMKGCR